jgi:hypothetical protein
MVVEEWRLQLADLKKYPHFDPVISAAEAKDLVRNPVSVATHTFYPFVRYSLHWNRFAEKGKTGDPKDREIRYAARSDAYIYSYYRYLLSIPYETELEKAGLGSAILAYRRIASETDGGGKCNIHFALDAFTKIRALAGC